MSTSGIELGNVNSLLKETRPVHRLKSRMSFNFGTANTTFAFNPATTSTASVGGGLNFGVPSGGQTTTTAPFSFGAPTQPPPPTSAPAPATAGFNFGSVGSSSSASGLLGSTTQTSAAPTGGLFNFNPPSAAPNTAAAAAIAPAPALAPAPTTGLSASFSFTNPAPTTTATSAPAFNFQAKPMGTATTEANKTAAAPAIQPSLNFTAKPNLFGTGLGTIVSVPTAAPAPAPVATSTAAPIAAAATTAAAAPAILPTLFSSQTPASTTTTTPLGLTTTSTPQISLAAATATATTTAAAALATLTTVTSTSSASIANTGVAVAGAAPTLSVSALEDKINKWASELKEKEERLLRQAAHVNAWDQLLQVGHDQVQQLRHTLNKVKTDQTRLQAELDFIQGQQQELEQVIEPLEVTAASTTPAQHQGDRQRENMHLLAQNLDSQLRQMTDDLCKVIEHLNTNSSGSQASDPVNTVARVLSAHMDTLKWVDQNAALLNQKMDDLSRISESKAGLGPGR
ncbi:hypothetical protein Pmani_016863 [Petrolisthes manimaculis]|uniref:Nucleoporin NSP1-like C-terminal domain-containing protein n=1 Tax=Petrolisthes manimaculis TaxID=1843537 RepID=A0AAE1PPI9_9EUCA|nr:hypothetical protein Pmani_016863 [Petrolisthes manimaculis]